ncbi:MAG: ankyrin repeat domain-containing protein [Chloroflexota bacterium]|nr:ankyrin repeat domain-containing protein [Chloroflexota bacterium]
MSPQLSLPSNPNLRQLRNQAKDLWRAFKSREPDASLRFRQSLPQLAGLSDEDIFGAKLGLKDAQRALAIEYGLADWEALKRHVESVTAGKQGPVYPEGDLPELVAAILRAVEDADVDRVRALLDKDPTLVHVRVRSDFEEGDTLLHRSSPHQVEDDANPHEPHLQVAQLLIDRGADIDAVGGQENTVGSTPLDAAAWAGRVAMVRLLLQNGADPEKGGHDGVDYNPVSTAVSHGRKEIFKLLIDAGAQYGIQHTIRMGMLEETRELLDADPSLLNGTKKVDPRWPEGEVPLVLAAGDREIFNLLLERGADVNARDPRGYTPLMAARSMGNDAGVQAILERGVSQDIFGAIMDKDAERVRELLRDDPTAANPVGEGPVPLIWAGRYGDYEIIRMLLEAGAEPNVWRDVDHFGKTALDMVISYQKDDVVRLMLDYGADPEFKGEGNQASTLRVALRNGTVSALKMLLEAGADANRADNFFGAWGGNLPKIKVLLDHGRCVGEDSPPDGLGREDLSIAAGNGQNLAVELLICHGADPEYVDKDGMTAIQQARKERQVSTIELLNEHAQIRMLPNGLANEILAQRRLLMEAYLEGEADGVAGILDAEPALMNFNVFRVSLLHDAAFKGRGDVVDVLQKRGAPMTIHAACALGWVETVQVMLDDDPGLLEALYIDQPMAEQTPLKIAANMAETGVFNLLLDRGADINSQVTLPGGGNGASTVLHGAVYSDSIEMVRLALARGADVSLTNPWGATALGTNWQNRQRRNVQEISQILIAHGANPQDRPQAQLIH